MQAYDGAAFMCGKENGGRTSTKKPFPHAHNVYYYEHQALFVLKQVLSCVTEALLFFVKFSGFTMLFSVPPKFSDLFRK